MRRACARQHIDNSACGTPCKGCSSIADRQVRLQPEDAALHLTTIALVRSTLELQAAEALHKTLRRGTRSRLRTMPRTMPIASTEARPPAPRGFSR